MKFREPDCPRKAASGTAVPPAAIFCFLFSTFLFISLVATILGGCAAPGEPSERKLPTPDPVKDLAASQLGNEVTLTFTLPRDSVERRQLQQPLTIQVYRDFEAVPAAVPSASVAPRNPALLLTVPPAMADQFATQGHIRLTDTLRPDDFTAAGREAIYIVKTFVSPKKLSPGSNVAALAVFPPAEPISDLSAKFTPAGVVLAWTPPQKTIIGGPPAVASYRVYRAEAGDEASSSSAAASSSAANGSENPAPKIPFARIAEPLSASFTDTQTQLGKTYIYAVRTVSQYPNTLLESLDSNFSTITPKDVFPPAAPQDLVVAFVPAAGGTPAYLELSWAINPATDIAGYNIYRSEGSSNPGTRVNSELLLTPAFRDMNVQPGRSYSYTVTAVDRAGNESPPSAPVSGSVAVENQ